MHGMYERIDHGLIFIRGSGLGTRLWLHHRYYFPHPYRNAQNQEHLWVSIPWDVLEWGLVCPVQIMEQVWMNLKLAKSLVSYTGLAINLSNWDFCTSRIVFGPLLFPVPSSSSATSSLIVMWCASNGITRRCALNGVAVGTGVRISKKLRKLSWLWTRLPCFPWLHWVLQYVLASTCCGVQTSGLEREVKRKYA